MSKPLVSVICLCFNQKPYLRATIQSVLDQQYQNVELIVFEVASTDGSKELIDQLIAAHPGIKFFSEKKKINYSKAFCIALKHAKGDYVIKLDAGDILNVNRIEEGVNGFLKRDSLHGLNYCDAEFIDDHNNSLGTFYSSKKSLRNKPEGNIFKDLLIQDFIHPPTLMYRKTVMDDLSGDESQMINIFYFLLRTSKKFKAFYINEALVKVRVPSESGSEQQPQDRSSLRNTYQVLLNAHALLQKKDERKAWKKRIKFEWIKSIKAMDWGLVISYMRLFIKK